MNFSPSAAEFEILSESAILTNLDPLALKTIVQAATPHKIERGGFLFHQGEQSTSFFVLIEGRTRLSQIADDGRQVIFHYFGPGDAMGVVVTLANAQYPVSAEAMSDTIALVHNSG